MHIRKNKTAEEPKRRKQPRRKLARVAREQERPKQKTQHSSIKFIKGGCESSSCGAEAACLQHKENNDTQHYCVCTSNAEPATEDFKCPRSTVPITHKAIHNIIPPQTSNSSDVHVPHPPAMPPTAQAPKSLVSSEILAEATASSDTTTIDYGSYTGGSKEIIMGTVLGGAVLFILVLFIAIYLKKKLFGVVDGKVQPRVRPGEPLLAERYIRNPQYGVCGAGTVNANESHEPGVTPLERNALRFIEEVGEGCFGKVHKGILRSNSSEKIVAIKVLKESAGRSAEEDFVREVSIMSAFRHPNILTLIGVVYKDDISASPWMVFEYMEWGDLAGVLRGSRGGGRQGPTLDEPALLHVALQVARGMQYLASRHFVHRDLAARNCLVGANLAVKIADFGMSRDVYTCDYYKMGGERPMPVRWMSPESIVYARFTHESDVWSYGVVLWEIYSRGKQPFYGCNNDGATKRVLQGILLVPPEDCPRFACELMRACWATDPRDRIKFDEICVKLETATAAAGSTIQIRLPRPPLPPQDSTGYLIPKKSPAAVYLKPLPDPEQDSDFSEDYEDEEYT